MGGRAWAFPDWGAKPWDQDPGGIPKGLQVVPDPYRPRVENSGRLTCPSLQLMKGEGKMDRAVVRLSRPLSGGAEHAELRISQGSLPGRRFCPAQVWWG